jgi:negative regulator of sigma F NrsF-like protein
MSTDVPPPSPALIATLADLRPVRTRRPLVEAMGVALASLGAMAALLVWSRPRFDVGSLAVIAAAVACALVFTVELWWALVPPRGQVLPLRRAAGARVLLAWALMLGALVAAGHAMTPDPAFGRSAVSCLVVGALVALTPAALCLLLLRRALDVGGWRVGALVGGAAGALGGLSLELHCANTHVAHVVLAHGGVILLPALLLALVLRK